ncbi:MAG: LysR family transcriptional regulator [Pseudomonadota bacterium]
MKSPRVTIEQWRALLAVVDAGGYAAAAEALDKSQSTVTYAVKKLEAVLGVAAFAVEGRRAVLTPVGRLLYDRARQLVGDAARLEAAAGSVSAGWEAEIGLSVEVLFPTWLLLECLDRFGADSPHTSIELYEAVMRGAQEDLMTGRAALAVTPLVPAGFLGDPILKLRFVAVAHPEHPLHRLARPLSLRDLRRHRHIVVRETSTERSAGTVTRSEMRWTVSNMPTSIGAVCRGFGFAWFPVDKIRAELAAAELKPLPLESGAERFVTIYLVLADPDGAGPGVRRLAGIIRDAAAKLPDSTVAGN